MEKKNRKIMPICTFRKKYWFRAEIRKKINDVNSFNESVNNIEEMITYFKDLEKKTNQKRNTKIKNVNYTIKVIWYNCYYCHNTYFYNIICYRNWVICS